MKSKFLFATAFTVLIFGCSKSQSGIESIKSQSENLKSANGGFGYILGSNVAKADCH